MMKQLSIFLIVMMACIASADIANVESDQVFARQFGTARNSTILSNAVTAIGTNSSRTLVVDGGRWLISQDLELGTNITVKIGYDTTLAFTNGAQLTFNGYVNSKRRQCFQNQGALGMAVLNDNTFEERVFMKWPLTELAITQELAYVDAEPAEIFLGGRNSGAWVINTNVTITSNVVVKIEPGSYFSIATNQTLNFDCVLLDDTLEHVFQGSGSVSGKFSNAFIRPEWWGAKPMLFQPPNWYRYSVEYSNAVDTAIALQKAVDFSYYGKYQSRAYAQSMSVKLGPYTYGIDRTISFSSGVTIEGDPMLQTLVIAHTNWVCDSLNWDSYSVLWGTLAMFQQREDDGLYNWGNHAGVIRNIRFHASSIPNMSCLVIGDQQENGRIEDCLFTQYTRYGLVLGHHGKPPAGEAADTSIKNCNFGASANSHYAVGLYLSPFSGGYIEIKSCTFGGVGSAAHAIAPAGTINWENIHIECLDGITVSGGSHNFTDIHGYWDLSAGTDTNLFMIRSRKIDGRGQLTNISDERYAWPWSSSAMIYTNSCGTVTNILNYYAQGQGNCTRLMVRGLHLLLAGANKTNLYKAPILVDEYADLMVWSITNNPSWVYHIGHTNTDTTPTYGTISEYVSDACAVNYFEGMTSYWYSTATELTDLEGTRIDPRFPARANSSNHFTVTYSDYLNAGDLDIAAGGDINLDDGVVAFTNDATLTIIGSSLFLDGVTNISMRPVLGGTEDLLYVSGGSADPAAVVGFYSSNGVFDLSNKYENATYTLAYTNDCWSIFLTASDVAVGPSWTNDVPGVMIATSYYPSILATGTLSVAVHPGWISLQTDSTNLFFINYTNATEELTGL